MRPRPKVPHPIPHQRPRMDREEQGRERMSEASCPYRGALDGTERDTPGRLVSHLKTGRARALVGSNPTPSAHYGCAAGRAHHARRVRTRHEDERCSWRTPSLDSDVS